MSSYREKTLYNNNKPMQNNMQNSMKQNITQNAPPLPVSFLSSTYDPSRQRSATQQSMKSNAPLLTEPNMYPQISNTGITSNPSNYKNALEKLASDSKYIEQYDKSKSGGGTYTNPVNTSSKTYKDTKNTNTNANPNSTPNAIPNSALHPSQSGKPFLPVGLPTHPNHPASSNTSSNNSLFVDKMSEKIFNHFKTKYPSTIEASGFNKNTITTIINYTIKKEPINEKTVSKIIDIIDHKFKTTINSGNRQDTQYDTTSFAMDDEIKISMDKYLENYTNKVTILQDSSDKAIEADLPKSMAPVDTSIEITPPEPFTENFPSRDRENKVDLMNQRVKEHDFYIYIDSNDRNIINTPKPNNFQIQFAPAPSGGSGPQTGYIERSFHNIKSCELLNISILDTSNIAGSSDYGKVSYPYLMLEFDELQQNYYGTNSRLSKAFAILTDYTTIGKYKYYTIVGETAEHMVYKIYNPRINLTKLTTRLLLPNGTEFNFGDSLINDTSNSCISFGFRITTMQKQLTTNFLNNA